MTSMSMIPKYPKTFHLADSRLPPGNENQQSLWGLPFERLVGQHMVIEEKVDGSQAGLCFGEAVALNVFSRGSTCPRNRNFGPLWSWAELHADQLFDVLEDRYILYGEWALLVHTVYYDALPAYFLEDDVYDGWTGEWLSTEARRKLLEPLRESCGLVSVPVLHEGPVADLTAIKALVGRSKFKSDDWPHALVSETRQQGTDMESVLSWVDPSNDMEGIYIKVEKEGRVTGRLKWVRHDFLVKILTSGTHWTKRQPVLNRLKE